MIYICGDTHGDYDISKITTKKWPEQKNLTRNDYLIILGDFAVPWSNDFKNREDLYMMNFYAQRKFTVLVVPGNHDNYERIFNLPEVEMFGSTVYKLQENIYFFKRGEVYEIDGKIIFTIGGGFSIDKARRRNRISWWEEEIPSYGEMNHGMDRILQFNNKVDYILTHTCSNITFKKLNYKIDLNYKIKGEEVLRKYLDWIEENVEFKEWHFGHFHDDLIIDDKHFLHYNVKPYLLS
jgi:predicted phosphodiesterase